jgi:hypothetical protein
MPINHPNQGEVVNKPSPVSPNGRKPSHPQTGLSSEVQHAFRQKRSQHHALFHLEEGQTDTPISPLHLGVGPLIPSHTPLPRPNLNSYSNKHLLLEMPALTFGLHQIISLGLMLFNFHWYTKVTIFEHLYSVRVNRTLFFPGFPFSYSIVDAMP